LETGKGVRGEEKGSLSAICMADPAVAPKALTPEPARRAGRAQSPKELGQDGRNEDVITLIDNLNEAIQTLGDTGAGAKVKSIWRRSREKISKCCKKDTDSKNDVEKRLERIEKAVQALRPSKPAYADVLKGSPAATQALAERKKKEVMLKIKDKDEAKTILAATNQELVAKIRKEAPGNISGEIIGVQKLVDGRVKVQVASKAAAEALQTENRWAHCVAQSASVTRRLFAVMVHGMNRKELGEDTTDILDKLMRENCRTHPGLQIAKARWLARELPEGKTHTALVIEVPTEQMANRLIREGITEGFAVKMCEYFETGSIVIRCYKCQGFGHTRSVCKSVEVVCGHCAGKHETTSCQQIDRAKCNNCKKAGHKTWDKRCEQFIREKEKARACLASKPYLYPEATTSPAYEPIPFTFASNKRPRATSPKPTGRPSGLRTAASSRNQQTLNFQLSQASLPSLQQSSPSNQTGQSSQAPQSSQSSSPSNEEQDSMDTNGE
jgi:hypothetical protein